MFPCAYSLARIPHVHPVIKPESDFFFLTENVRALAHRLGKSTLAEPLIVNDQP